MPSLKQRRETRKTRREKRREKLKNLIDLGKDLKDLPDDFKNGDYKAVLKQVWPFLSAAFDFIKVLRVTGQQIDLIMDELIKMGNKLVNDEADADATAFQQKIAVAWGPIRTILNLVTVFTAEKVDKVIDKIIEIGDWLSGQTSETDTALTD